MGGPLLKGMEQKEVPNGFRDEACGKETPAGYAGLCQ